MEFRIRSLFEAPNYNSIQESPRGLGFRVWQPMLKHFLCDVCASFEAKTLNPKLTSAEPRVPPNDDFLGCPSIRFPKTTMGVYSGNPDTKIPEPNWERD